MAKNVKICRHCNRTIYNGDIKKLDGLCPCCNKRILKRKGKIHFQKVITRYEYDHETERKARLCSPYPPYGYDEPNTTDNKSKITCKTCLNMLSKENN